MSGMRGGEGCGEGHTEGHLKPQEGQFQLQSEVIRGSGKQM